MNIVKDVTIAPIVMYDGMMLQITYTDTNKVEHALCSTTHEGADMIVNRVIVTKIDNEIGFKTGYGVLFGESDV
jgi:hypothetical protein